MSKLSESEVQSKVRLGASRKGILLFRNNSGACVDGTGRLIRYGLGNDSKALNEKIKSSDLIGITSVKILPEHVGMTIGVFTAIECKSGDWKPSNSLREAAQKKFLDIVRKLGGIGKFISNPEHVGDIKWPSSDK